MLNIYIYKTIQDLEHIPILDYHLGTISYNKQRTGDKARKSLRNKYFNLITDPDKSDYFLLPHSYFHIKDKSYIDEFVNLSIKHNKKLLVFSYGDSDDDINLPNSIVFRSSQYRYKVKKNEVIFPAIADDLLEGRDFQLREKAFGSKIPVIGFCGWADFENSTRRIKEYIKLIFLGFKKYVLFDRYALLHKRGILFRRKAISILTRSGLVKTNFIIRSSYSGSEKTRKISAEQSLSEYIGNILESDFVLTVKGDGNFSIRLYEILSLGRVPLYIDTDCILPMEDVIDYNKFILKVSCSDIKNIAKIVSKFYEQISPEGFQEMQRLARKMFNEHLRVDKYAEYIFLDPELTLLKKYE